MLIVYLTKEILNIALISRPQTLYELSDILCISYKRMQSAVRRYGIDLLEGNLPWRKESSNEATDRLEKLVFEGNTLEIIAKELNLTITSVYRSIKTSHLHDQWRRARAEKILGLLEN